jgi:nucleoid-associated protein YgaU
MDTLNFTAGAGANIFSNGAAETVKASELVDFIKKLGLTYKNIKIATSGQNVTIEGEVDKQADAEKIAIAVGNVGGVASVQNKMRVTVSEPASQFYTVVNGDSLSKIAGKFYGDVQKYNTIFEANKPMLSDPDKIYPGQVLRIPANAV